MDITVDFAPVKAMTSNNRKKLVEYRIVPTFNNDKKHYSHAFFNPYEGLEND